MSSIVAKRCPECGGKPKYVYYYVPEEAGGSFEFDENGEYSPDILLKRVECTECGATVAGLSFTLDGAIKCWNKEFDGHRLILRKYGEGKIYNVEPQSAIKILSK